jgi:6-phosphogluconate dehydrogenase-like protein/alcohol dehydrogenase-like protein
MKAITVEPHKPGSARFEDVPEPDARNGSVLVEAVAVGVCGTDVEIVEGKYGWAPPGSTRLVLGHESLGRVVDPGPAADPDSGRRTENNHDTPGQAPGMERLRAAIQHAANEPHRARDTPMQLGMIGLGRMGANIVRRLIKNGHACVGYDRSAQAVNALVTAATRITWTTSAARGNSPPRRFITWTSAPAAASGGWSVAIA